VSGFFVKLVFGVWVGDVELLVFVLFDFVDVVGVVV